MKGFRILIASVLAPLAIVSSTAFARVGEGPRAIEQRYGPPISTDAVSGFTRCNYEKQAYAVTIFYQQGRSILEIFAKRGLGQDEARQLVAHIAACPVRPPDPAGEAQLRQAARITSQDEVFWTWAEGGVQVTAAFDPIECTVAFFTQPGVYARVQQALLSDPLAGS